MNQFVYHFKPKSMSGDLLIPLNDLKETQPLAYAEHIRKYQGREHLLKEQIPLLNCLWNDVLHMSPINPQIIIDTWRKERLYDYAEIPVKIEVYKIPVALLKEDSTLCFQSYNYDFDNYDRDLEKYWKFDKLHFLEKQAVDPKQIKVWKTDKKSKRDLLWYSHTQHILARQQIDTRLCEVIYCE